MKFQLASIVTFFSLLTVNAHLTHKLGWSLLDTRLPKPLSDHSASLSKDNGLVYIAGGCDSPKGNEFAGDFFFCATISDSLYIFNPPDRTFGEASPMPRQRYRHCGEIVNNQLWVLGGRNAMDEMIGEVDVYDVVTDEWSSYLLPEDYQISDQACFVEPGSSYLYVAGGYNGTYNTLSTVYRIDTSSPSSTLEVEEMAPLLQARGDIFGASDLTSAYVAGGFTDDNNFCAPIETAEKYDFASNSWSYLPEMVNDRGEIVLVELDGHIYAMGGERQIEGICELTGDTDPGELTVGTELVEVLDDQEWKVLEHFDNHKFRFAAVAVNSGVYTFGGQTAWDDDCECFKTTDDIQVLGKAEVANSANPGFQRSLMIVWFGLAVISLCEYFM